MNKKRECERAGYEYEKDLQVHPNNSWSISVLRRLDELGLFHTENMELSALGDDVYVGGSCCEMHLC